MQAGSGHLAALYQLGVFTHTALGAFPRPHMGIGPFSWRPEPVGSGAGKWGVTLEPQSWVLGPAFLLRCPLEGLGASAERSFPLQKALGLPRPCPSSLGLEAQVLG